MKRRKKRELTLYIHDSNAIRNIFLFVYNTYFISFLFFTTAFKGENAVADAYEGQSIQKKRIKMHLCLKTQVQFPNCNMTALTFDFIIHKL